MNSILIKKGESIPCEVSESYFTVYDGQAVINCTITESKSPETDPRFVKIIHEERLELPPGRPSGQEIIICYSYDENQIIHASFKDVESGNEKKISISMDGQHETSSDINKFLVD
jgi:molecular chaperone DnaK